MSIVPDALTVPHCSHCNKSQAEGKGDAFKKCGGCKQVYYCSAECQKNDWKEHKSACKPNRPLDPSSSDPCESTLAKLQVGLLIEKTAATELSGICDLCHADAKHASKFGVLGACELVVSAMKAHPGSRRVSLSGCRAMFLLLKDVSGPELANNKKLRNKGALAVVMTAMRSQVKLQA
jgi:hypothetical protein